jgi:hypothetical protein
MARPPKIDLRKLEILLREEGKSRAECAEFFGVSTTAISQARKKLTAAVTKYTSTEIAPQVADKWLNTIDQLQKINREANRLLDTLEDAPETKIRVMSEIRGQLKLQLDIMQALYDVRAAEEFQKEVLDTIAEVDPNVRDEILHRLEQKRVVRSAVSGR